MQEDDEEQKPRPLEEENHQEAEKCRKRIVLLRRCLRLFLEFVARARGDIDDGVGAGADAALIVVDAKTRQDLALDDDAGDGVGERALEAIADFDANLALVRRDDQHDAVVAALLADAPMAAELVAVFLNRPSAQRFQRDDDELRRRFGLETFELGIEVDLRRGIENVRFVDDAAGELREIVVLRECDPARREQQECAEQEQPDAGVERRAHDAPALALLLEIDLRRLHLLLGDGERLHRLVAAIENVRPDDAGESSQLGVIDAHCFDVVAPRNRDAVLGAFELRLQREEVGVRFQVRVILLNRQEPSEHARELRLRLLEFLEGFRIGDRGGVDLDRGRFRARFDHRRQHLALLLRVALHRFDEVRDEIGAALVLVQHFAPRRFRALFFRGDGVDAAAGELKCEKRDSQGSNDTSTHGKLPF